MKEQIYLGDLENKSFIKIGFLFKNKEGAKRVFQDLIDKATTNDEEGKIIVSFIKGIDKDKIYDYRVMITGKVKVPKITSENILFNNLTRFHQMNCENDKNIKILEEIIDKGTNPHISILPMIMGDNHEIMPLWDYEIKLKKINIKQAYEISKNDIEAAVILKTDNPLIPKEIEDAPINELLELKRTME